MNGGEEEGIVLNSLRRRSPPPSKSVCLWVGCGVGYRSSSRLPGFSPEAHRSRSCAETPTFSSGVVGLPPRTLAATARRSAEVWKSGGFCFVPSGSGPTVPGSDGSLCWGRMGSCLARRLASRPFGPRRTQQHLRNERVKGLIFPSFTAPEHQHKQARILTLFFLLPLFSPLLCTLTPNSPT